MIPGLYLGAGAAVIGLLVGAGCTRAHYVPQLDAADKTIQILGVLLDSQNSQVRALDAAAQAQKAKTDAALAAAADRAKRADARARDLVARPLPAGKNACEAACDLLLEPLGREGDE